MSNLHKHLRMLEPQGLSIWYAQKGLPGASWRQERDRQLQAAQLVLFLVSANFFAASEQREQEVRPTMERHARGEVYVIPIILSPVGWQNAPFGHLSPLPSGGKPITDWKPQDQGFFDIYKGVKAFIEEKKIALPASAVQQKLVSSGTHETAHPRSDPDALPQLETIIQNLVVLRGQIASYVRLSGPKGFNLKTCEHQYDKFYGDTLVFLATHLPETVSEASEGFVESIHQKARVALHERSDIYVSIARTFISPLARMEELAAEIDACISTLTFYKQKYFFTA